MPRAQGTGATYLTYWLENVAVHQLRETTHTRYTAVVEQYFIPGLAGRSSRSSPPRTSAPGSTNCGPSASAAHAVSTQGATVVIKELLGHAHIGVTAGVYARVRLRLQRDAIDLLGPTLRNPAETASQPGASNDAPSCALPLR